MRSSAEGTSPRDAGAPENEGTRIECHADLSGFFHETLTRALTIRRVAAKPSTAFYLVGLLAHLGHDTSALSRSMVALSLEAEAAAPSERFGCLRQLGDQALSVSGLFDVHLDRLGVGRSYLVELGSRAYRGACQLASAHPTERARAEIFFDLGEHFETYAHVLEDVREATALGTKDDVLALYERFQKTHSPAIAERLLAHGVVSMPPGEEAS